MTTWTRNIGSNRGKPRLWLEGAILTECGFKHGDCWRVVRGVDNTLLLHKGKKGDRRVAGTPERPIIDINSGTLLAGLGPKVEITKEAHGLIRVETLK